MGKTGWMVSNLKKTYRYLRRNGVRPAILAAAERLLQEREQRGYTWQAPPKEELERQRREAAAWHEPPLFSIAVPAYETPPLYLKELLDSLQAQTWPYWELVLADAGSGAGTEQAVRRRGDERIRYHKLPCNGGIAENTNAALREAKGDYIGLLDHDDVLTPDALYHMACAVRERERAGERAALLYSDEDKYEEGENGGAGRFYELHRKPDFDLDLLLSNNYICHFLVMEAGLIRELGERGGYDGAQDYDLVLRAAGRLMDEGREADILHVPRVLYHWRCHQASTAANPASKSYAYEAGKRALEDFCRERGWKAEVTHLRHLGYYRVSFQGDILAARPDLGAVAGPLPPVRGKLNSGIYDAVRCEGAGTPPVLSMRYCGLPSGFTGPFHRAILPQEAEAADIRTMRVRPEFQAELDQAVEALRRGADPARTSLEFCALIRRKGLRILWDPSRKEGAK